MIRPLHDHVLLKMLRPDTTEGGLLIPEHAHMDQTEAIVIAVGPKAEGIEPGNIVIVKGGSVCMVVQDGPTSVISGAQKLMLAIYSDVVAVRTPNEPTGLLS